MSYRNINNLLGWATGIVAFVVYLLTMEPTVSFWDCGEFLACAYKVEVGHSPGAPLFMLLQRVFGLLAGGNAWTAGPSQNAAAVINAFSALVSALTIVFLFWTITHMARKLLVSGEKQPEGTQTFMIMGAGLVGALAYTFSDTFWFSAVEAEVYATSSFFTALVFWAILKWEDMADNRYADRWLVFIAYMMGLSIGIHLLNLLTIPALAMVYYFKRYEPTLRGGIIAFLIGCAMLALVQFGVIQGIPALAFRFDLLFVNGLGLPFDTGAIFFLLLVAALLIGLLIYARKKNYYLLHTGMLCLIFVCLGFTSYFAPVIRSRADVAIDMTNPDNADRFLSYVNREQFGQQPLLWGPDFNTPVVDYTERGKLYDAVKQDGKDRYVIVGKKPKPVFDHSRERFFPRIWDYNNPSHANFYRNYLGLGPDEDPTSADNFAFFFRYQLNWMWWRYFMWNYAGRQNDVEGQGDPRSGNWISGIKFLDKGRVGDLDKMGDGFRNNRARNELYFLPLILGIMGMVYHFNRHRKDAFIVLLLFFFTGIAVVLYLNNTPVQPRERDYAYAGSTYAFAIWIGLGVLMAHDWMQRALKGKVAAFATVLICLLAVPALMAKEEWDDHDRSKKTLARASAWNTLQSCEKNAILFTFGDNDTYPLWYLQEVEGIRTDVRVINLSLLGIDWYIDQLNYKINDADAVPMIWSRDKYMGDKRNGIVYYNNPAIPQNKYISLIDVCNFIIDENKANQLTTRGGEFVNYLPTKNFFVPSLDKEELVARGLIKAEDTGRIINEMKFNLGKDAAYKDDLAVMNIVAAIARDGWRRPIYFGGGLPGDNYQGMQDYLKLEGMVYRLVPFKYADTRNTGRQDIGFVDADKSFDLYMNTYQWGGGERNDVYFDEKNRIMFTAYRNNAPRIAEELARAGRQEDAKKLMDLVDKSITQSSYAYNPYMIGGFDPSAYFMTMGYYNIGAKEDARRVANMFINNLEADVNWILTLTERRREEMTSDVQRNIGVMNAIGSIALQSGDEEYAREVEQKMQALAGKVTQAMGANVLQQR